LLELCQVTELLENILEGSECTLDLSDRRDFAIDARLGEIEPIVRRTPLGRDELVVIAAPAHPWAARRRIEARELAGEPLLVYERRSSTYHIVERMLLEAGVFPRIVMEMDHLGAVSSMVRAGLGLAVVPHWAVSSDVNAGQLVALSIGKTGLYRAWGLGVRAEDHQPQTLRAFVRLCRERLSGLLAG